MHLSYDSRGSPAPPHNPPPKNELKIAVPLPYQEEEIPDEIHVIDMPDQRVDWAMGERHQQWCNHQATLIAAPTGSYKTTYIGRLIKWYASQGKKTLVLGPRDMLRSEHKRRLPALAGSKWAEVFNPKKSSDENAVDSERDRAELALDLTREFRDVHLEIMTFQELARQYTTLTLKKYSLVVVDEAHRAHTDALFDTSADFVLENIPMWFSGACRLYLTATPGAILDDLVRVEKASPAYCPGIRSCSHLGCGQIQMYRFPNHFDGLSLRYYREVDEMVALIKAHPGEKFIVFVSHREDTNDTTRSYYAKLKAAGIDAAYLDSNEKGSDTWKFLRKHNKFPNQVLVTTKVLDVGFNIIDASLRHVVLETFDKTEFIQELGRKRRSAGEHIHVYVKAAPLNVLRGRLRQIEYALSICEAGLHSQSRPNHSLLLEGWNDEDPARLFSKLLIPTSADTFKVRLSAYHALLWQEGTLNKLIRMYDSYGDAAYPRLVHQWLEDPDGYSDENWLGFDAELKHRMELVEYLEQHLGEFPSDDECEEFTTHLRTLLVSLHSEQHDESRKLGYRALTNRLSALDLPYSLEKKGETFMLRRTN